MRNIIETVSVATIDIDRAIWLCQRSRDSSWPLCWQFPGGKVDDGEWPIKAAIRECQEEAGLFPAARDLVYMDCIYLFAEKGAINKQHQFVYDWAKHPKDKLHDAEPTKIARGWTAFTIKQVEQAIKEGERLMPGVVSMLLELFPGCSLSMSAMPVLTFERR